MASPDVDLAIAVPTFIGSVLSFVATTIAIALHVYKPPKRHFRHALIINLLVAGQSTPSWFSSSPARPLTPSRVIDFINSLNNTISGAIALANGHQDETEAVGPACPANAWIGQFSVQAVDFNILIISIVVLYTVINSRLVAESSTKATVGICVAAWIPGLITSKPPRENACGPGR